jgi:hypothetical protein
MPKISFSSKGSFTKTDNFLKKMSKGEIFRQLEGFGKEGVAALSAATPVSSSTTAQSWNYTVHHSMRSSSITWTNSNIVDGVPIAIILQYGHGTGTGGYVQGRDYINPALKPVFDKIANKVWKAVTYA